MDKNSNKFVVLFQTAVCVVLALLLAGAYNALSDSIRANEAFDQQRNILKAVGLYDPSEPKTRKELEAMFEKSMRAEILEVTRAEVEREVMRAGEMVTITEEVVTDVKKTEHPISKLDALLREEKGKPAAEQREYAPFYRRVDDAGNDVAYCIPISGKGLWSTLYGYLALKKDANHVAGITFYKHAETPGLGGEIENPAWQASWVDQEILDDEGNLVSIAVKKGGAAPGDKHAVDGLSGATITGNGVQRFVRRDLETYLPYLKEQR